MISLVAKEHGHHMHVCHVNDPAQVELVAQARHEGLPVTCGICPHHFLKTGHSRKTEGKFAEMQPPLADEVDVERLTRQLADGDIQIIETDHAPHTKESKWQAEENGSDCFGLPSIQQAVALVLYQVRRGNLTIERMVDAMSTQPAALLGVKVGHQTYSRWELELGRIESEEHLVSGAGWTPYLGMNTGGNLIQSVIRGAAVYNKGAINKLHHPAVTKRGSEI